MDLQEKTFLFSSCFLLFPFFFFYSFFSFFFIYFFQKGESDHVTNCAHNFPAVLDTIGSARWDELKDIYFDLIKNQNVKVRRTLAFSLHAVASILGE